jgi:hypothetical protein
MGHEKKKRVISRALFLLTAVFFFGIIWLFSLAAQQSLRLRIEQLNELPCYDFSEVPGVIWWGNDQKISLHDLARYCAPICGFHPMSPC